MISLKWALVLVLFVFGIDKNPLYSKSNVSEILKQIPDSDRNDLDRFFQLLIKNENMGFTLFGDKPITLAGFLNTTYLYPYAILCIICEKGWAAWLRNRHLVSDDHFVLKMEKDSEFSYSFYLINKKYTIKKIKENVAMFRQKLGEDVTCDQILEEICALDVPINQILPSQSLLGIFLGYGKNNALVFEKEEEIEHILCSKLFPPFVGKDRLSSLCLLVRKSIECDRSKGRYILPRQFHQFSEYVTELNCIAGARKDFVLKGSDSFLQEFSSPAFVYWNDQEALELQESYARIRSNLKSAYTKTPFLEITFQQWISPKWP